MLRDAEKQFLSALKTSDMVTTVLELSKVGFGTPVMQSVHMPLPLIHLLLLACLLLACLLDGLTLPYSIKQEPGGCGKLQRRGGWLRYIYVWISHRQHCSSTLRQQNGSLARQSWY